jgi:hypothetical protein
LGLAALTLAGCSKQGPGSSGLADGAESYVADEVQLSRGEVTEVEIVGDEVSTRYADFMAGLHSKEATVLPTAAEIQQFSEAEVAKGMLVRYRNFSDDWWAFMHRSNRGATQEYLILPANSNKDPIFTEIIAPVVKGMNLSPEQRRGVVEEYRFRTLTGLRDDMQQLLETELKPIAPDVMRQRPEALARHAILVANFQALEDRFMYFQFLDFPQVLGIEKELFERVTTEQEKVVVYARSLKKPETSEEAMPLIEEVSKKLDEYEQKLEKCEPNSSEYNDVLSAMMLLMEFQTRLMGMHLDHQSIGRVGTTIVAGDEFEAMPVVPRTPLGSFDLEIRESTEAAAPIAAEDTYTGEWSHWAEWYGVASYYFAMRHFDDVRTQYVHEALENQHCVGFGHSTCPQAPTSFDPMKAWVAGVAFAQETLAEAEGGDGFRGRHPGADYVDMEPPVYRFTVDHPKLSKYPVVVEGPSYSSHGKTLAVTTAFDVFPAYCEEGKPSVTPEGRYYYLPDHSWERSPKEAWHFSVVFPDNTYSPYGRESFPRTEGTLAALKELDAVVSGFCDAEMAYEPTVKGTLVFSDFVYPDFKDPSFHKLAIFAHCMMDDSCKDAPASSHHPIPSSFLQQLAREALAQSF